MLTVRIQVRLASFVSRLSCVFQILAGEDPGQGAVTLELDEDRIACCVIEPADGTLVRRWRRRNQRRRRNRRS